MERADAKKAPAFDTSRLHHRRNGGLFAGSRSMTWRRRPAHRRQVSESSLWAFSLTMCGFGKGLRAVKAPSICLAPKGRHIAAQGKRGCAERRPGLTHQQRAALKGRDMVSASSCLVSPLQGLARWRNGNPGRRSATPRLPWAILSRPFGAKHIRPQRGLALQPRVGATGGAPTLRRGNRNAVVAPSRGGFPSL